MQLIILAAGKGSRLPQKYRSLPKCLVRFNKKNLIDHNKEFINKFKKKIIITGYRSNILKKITQNYNFRYIRNKNFNKTNMVYSLFLAKKFVKSDVVIIYGDIIFDKKIFNLLKKKGSLIPVNINWLINWKKRMGFKKTLQDAEDLVIKKGIVKKIGNKIFKNKLPKTQFMGIIKLKKDTFNKIMNFFKKMKKNKIDMTSFLNICIQKKILKLNAVRSGFFWYEIDTENDYKFAKKELPKW